MINYQAAKYGFPYKGGKQKIADEIIDFLPVGSGVLHDVFSGGCSVSHCALLSGKWHTVKAYDREPFNKVLEQIIDGCFDFEKYERFVSREEFMATDDPVIKSLWSFGNNMRGYLHSDEVLELKEPAYRMLTEKTVQKRRYWYRVFIVKLRNNVKKAKQGLPRIELQGFERLEVLERLQKLQGFERLDRLERLQELEGLERSERLQGLHGLERLEGVQEVESECGDDRVPRFRAFVDDYTRVVSEAEEGDVVYFDPPYKGTGEYKNRIDYGEFYDTCRLLADLGCLVYVSEYTMPEDFQVVKEWTVVRKLNSQGSVQRCEEKLFAIR